MSFVLRNEKLVGSRTCTGVQIGQEVSFLNIFLVLLITFDVNSRA